MKIKNIFRNLILILIFLLTFNSLSGNTPVRSSNSFELESKLSEPKNEVKRYYQEDSALLSSGLTPVELKTYSTVKNNIILMDVNTVNNLKNLLDSLNNSRDESLKNLSYLTDISSSLKKIESSFDKANNLNEYLIKKSQKKVEQEAHAYLVWPIFVILSALSFIIARRRDSNIIQVTSLVIFTISLILTLYYISNIFILF